MSEQVEIDHLRSWIGKQERSGDIITPELVKRFRATLSGYTSLAGSQGCSLPLGLHWCLAPPAIAHDGLGADGHPAKGGFLPPVPLPRRMWASSRIRFHSPLPVGPLIERTSTITDVAMKQSRASGTLVFVHIDHEYTCDKETHIEDRQTIVYRGHSVHKKKGAIRESKTQPQETTTARSLTPDSTLLFRYSALTFNGHRIHYDHHYSVLEEGYPALVVQGPLTATLLMNLAQGEYPQKTVREFAFRAMAPAFVDEELRLAIDPGATTQDEKAAAASSIALDARNHRGELVTTASAVLTE
ncbi:Mesaconyl-C(4)-CoA hydratase [Halioglobus japonicus]|nr:Mesaconyl-C(4)-CoA hydratase [Halioglobus japonicus]